MRGIQIGHKENIFSRKDSPALNLCSYRISRPSWIKTWSNLICPHRCPGFEQELRLESSRDHFPPEFWSSTTGIVPFSYSIIDHISLLTFLICNHVQKRDETLAFSMTNTPYLFYLPLSLLPPPYQKLFEAQKAVPLRKKNKRWKKKYYTVFSIQNRPMINTCSTFGFSRIMLLKNNFTSIY